MQGKLYVCATPIGNLKDITIRCLETLEEVDIIASEDTRHTVKLLNHYDIKTHLESYHEHNKKSKGQKIINMLKDGKNVALVSDAGMPSISDPGEDLIKLCYENEIELTVLPGASASITGLVLSGINARSYCFEGFLPSNKKIKQEVLDKIKEDTRTYILYEAPHNLLDTLKLLYENIGNREIAVIKEMTKKYETVDKGDIYPIIQKFEGEEIRGEYVIIIGGVSREDLEDKNKKQAEELGIDALMEMYTKDGLSTKDAMKKIAKDLGVSKREIYAKIKIDKK